MDAAKRSLQLWNMNLNSRLFRSRRFDGVVTTDLHLFVAFPEHTQTENIHWHLLARLVCGSHARYGELASSMWKRVVPSGTSNVQLIRGTADDHLAVQAYATKKFANTTSHENFVTSNMLTDGRRSSASTQGAGE